MRADRLLALLWILTGEVRPVPTTELARELEVSPRTVLRDVEALSTAGVPVYCERGRYGGVRLVKGFRTDVTGMTAEEAFALFASTSLGTAALLGVAEPARSALRKVAAALPDAARSGRLASQRLLVDPEGWLPGQRDTSVAECLAAVSESREVQFRYRSGTSGRTGQYQVAAVGLVCAAGVWYLAGITSAGDVRFFRLDRAAALQDTGERAAHPDFDLQAAWREARDTFRAGLRPLSADLELDDAALAVLGGLATLDVRERRDGWTTVRAEFGDLAHATEVLPRVAAGVRVLGPPELVRAIEGLAEALARATAAGQR